MKITITGEISIEELNSLLDKLREHRKADEKEWEENHPMQPMQPFMDESPLGKKSKPN